MSSQILQAITDFTGLTSTGSFTPAQIIVGIFGFFFMVVIVESMCMLIQSLTSIWR